MPEVAVYPPELLDLLTPEGFEAQFWEMYRSQTWKSYEACYEALEARREAYFMARKYTDYNSFRVANTRRYKQKRAA